MTFSPAKPNIMIYFIDELRADALGCYGHPFVRTPSLDAIADEGMLFVNGISNCPLCMPARNSFHTGLYPSKHGIVFNSISEYAAKRVGPYEFGRLLKKAGYKRIINVGKHHTGFSPEISGYTEHYPFKDKLGAKPGVPPSGMDPERDELVMTKGKAPNVIIGGNYPGNVDNMEPCQVADHIIHLMDSLGNEPWVMRASFIAPHTPVLAPKPYSELYVNNVKDWPPEREQPERTKLVSRWNELRGFGLNSDNELRKARSSYYGLVTLLDEQIGRIEAELARRGLKENLLTIVIADHGASIGDHGSQVKGPFDTDDIARVPYMIRYPGRYKPGRYDGIVQLIDVLPTLSDLLETPTTAPLSGQSLRPALEGSHLPIHQAVFSEGAFPSIHPGMRESVRTDRYLFTRYPSIAESELFDLHSDPTQRRNVAAQWPDVVKECQKLLDDWRKVHPLHPDMFKTSSSVGVAEGR
jgi:arylsulfatase A-like enzyme